MLISHSDDASSTWDLRTHYRIPEGRFNLTTLCMSTVHYVLDKHLGDAVLCPWEESHCFLMKPRATSIFPDDYFRWPIGNRWREILADPSYA